MSVENIKLAQDLLGSIPLEKISQGAEAIIFLADKHPLNDTKTNKTIIKYRPRKPYRYPILDLQIIKQRTISESRIIQKLFESSIKEINNLKKENNENKVNYLIFNGGVNCPNLIGLDVYNGFIFMEYINDSLRNGNSSSLKNYLWLLENEFSDNLKETKLTIHNCHEIISSKDIENEVICLNSKIEELLIIVGIQLGNMHLFDIIHGDLTSSNIIVKQFDSANKSIQPDYIPYIIDFGLSYQSTLIEDKAVDLYVLEKAMDSTHPLFAKKYYNKWILKGYEKAYELKGSKENSKKSYNTKFKEIYKRLEAVRLRGRKRSMIG